MECNYRQGGDACVALCEEVRCPGEGKCVTTKFREGEDDVNYPKTALALFVASAPGSPGTLREGLLYMFPESRNK